jgi:hypothetical protein
MEFCVYKILEILLDESFYSLLVIRKKNMIAMQDGYKACNGLVTFVFQKYFSLKNILK